MNFQQELVKILGKLTCLEGIYELLLSIQGNAVKSAKKLEVYNLQGGKNPHTVEFMPSTEVYRIIKTIMEAEIA